MTKVSKCPTMGYHRRPLIIDIDSFFVCSPPALLTPFPQCPLFQNGHPLMLYYSNMATPWWQSALVNDDQLAQVGHQYQTKRFPFFWFIVYFVSVMWYFSVVMCPTMGTPLDSPRDLTSSRNWRDKDQISLWRFYISNPIFQNQALAISSYRLGILYGVFM